MRILVLGSTGMLGQALCKEAAARGHQPVGIARRGAGIAADVTDLRQLLERTSSADPDIVINTVADVDLAACERDPARAYLVNARPAASLAEWCRRTDRYFIHVSTDHYYTGDRDAKHDEGHAVRLVNEYARTKYAGEQFALTNREALVLRTNIVGLRHGQHAKPTFVEWVLQSIAADAPMTLFEDYFTSSITVAQFSAALFDLIRGRPSGVVNLASREVASKKRFVEAVAARLGRTLTRARAGTVAEAPGAARAESLGLDVARAEGLLGRPLPGLHQVIEDLVQDRATGNG